MNGYDKLEPENGSLVRSKLDLLGSSRMTGSTNESIRSKTLHQLARPILRATTLLILIHLASPRSPAPGISPFLPLTLVLGRTIGRRLGLLSPLVSGKVEDEAGRAGWGLGLGGKYAEYLGGMVDVGGCGAVCLVGRAGNVGGVLAGLSLVGLTREVENLLRSGSSSNFNSSIILAQLGLAITGIYTSFHLLLSNPTGWWTIPKTILGLVGVLAADHVKRGMGEGRGVIGSDGEESWKGRGVRGPEILAMILGLVFGYTLLLDTTPTWPSFSAIIVCLLLTALFAVGSPILLNTPTRKDVYRELGLVGFGLASLSRSGGYLGLVGLMLVGWVMTSDIGEMVEGEEEVQEENTTDLVSSWAWRMVAVGGLAVLGITTMLRHSPSLELGFGGDVGMVRGSGWRSEVDYELAISLYDEPVPTVIDTIKRVKRTLPRFSSSRTTIYTKKIERQDTAGLQALLNEAGVDEVVALDNMGREGETYLQHISRRYKNIDAPLARQTFFLQPHLAWDWVAESRLKTLHRNTGFVSLGPYLNASCSADGNEKDSHGMSFGRIPQIYSMFQGDLCPPTGFTITWAGQFVVSRKRILSTPLKTYHNLLGYFDAEKDSDDPKAWIWSEGWWNSQPTDPTHGHWLERSWPAVFKCSRLSLTDDCKDEGGPECECRDDVPGQGLL